MRSRREGVLTCTSHPFSLSNRSSLLRPAEVDEAVMALSCSNADICADVRDMILKGTWTM
jgi:hypothetical protein